MAFQLTNPYAAQTPVSDTIVKGQQIYSNNQKAGMDDQKLKAEEIKRLVSIVTPENYQSIRAEGVQKGLWSEEGAPADYESAAPIIQQIRQQFGSGASSTVPSAIQEYNFYKNLPQDEQERYIGIKRANPYLNLGDRFVQPTMEGEVKNEFETGLRPGEEPAIKGKQAREAAAGKVTGEAEGGQARKEIQAPQMDKLIKEAEKILPQATSGRLDKMATGTASFFGKSTDESKADKRLNVISAALTGNVPRFEGPQGVLDVELYKQAAGDVANRDIPYEDRLAALQTMKDLNAKYMPKPNLNTTINTQGVTESAPQRTITKTLVSPSTGMRKVIYSDGTEEIIPAGGN